MRWAVARVGPRRVNRGAQGAFAAHLQRETYFATEGSERSDAVGVDREGIWTGSTTTVRALRLTAS
jgi:hypothetical protein